MIKIAALSSWISGLGFGLPGIYAIWTLVKSKRIAYVLGFPTYGYGPFEKAGIHTPFPSSPDFFLFVYWSVLPDEACGITIKEVPSCL